MRRILCWAVSIVAALSLVLLTANRASADIWLGGFGYGDTLHANSAMWSATAHMYEYAGMYNGPDGGYSNDNPGTERSVHTHDYTVCGCMDGGAHNTALTISQWCDFDSGDELDIWVDSVETADWSDGPDVDIEDGWNMMGTSDNLPLQVVFSQGGAGYKEWHWNAIIGETMYVCPPSAQCVWKIGMWQGGRTDYAYQDASTF